MDNTKYIGMDVHKEAIAIVVLNAAGKLVMESIIETKANTILEFLKGLRGELHLTFEEGTWAGWLYDLLQPHLKRVVVCNPRRNSTPALPPLACPSSQARHSTSGRNMRS
jgi:hypothetical protein